MNKVTYVDGETTITAQNLNDIQDAISTISITEDTITIPSGRDYFYFSPRTGYKLINAYLVETYAGGHSVVIGYVDEGGNYTAFLKSATTAQKTTTLRRIWVEI